MLPPVGHLAPYADSQSLAAAAADNFGQLVQTKVTAGVPFRVALAGGSTPKQLYRLLAEMELPWKHIELYWGDERNVPLEHEDSNYRMVRETLLEPAGVDSAQVFPVPVDPDRPQQAAQRYSETLTQRFGQHPRFDLILLGLGDDAHTASLFPGTDALAVADRVFTENWVPKFDAFRLTLTVPTINAAEHVWFLVTGANKREALAHVWGAQRDPTTYPAQAIDPAQGILRWMVTPDAVPTGD